MKYIIMAVISMTMLKGCSQETTEQDMRSVTYTASSRGYYFQVTVDPTTVYVQSDRDGKNAQKNVLATRDWQELKTLVTAVSLKEFKNLKAPSEGRALDRAAIASLKVELSEEAYESVPFDHGNPPTAIKAIIDKVLLLAESVDRQ